MTVNFRCMCHCVNFLCDFRAKYGYGSSRWKDPPSTETKYIRKRAMESNKTLQCGKFAFCLIGKLVKR